MTHSINSHGVTQVGGFVRPRMPLAVPLLLLAWGGMLEHPNRHAVASEAAQT